MTISINIIASALAQSGASEVQEKYKLIKVMETCFHWSFTTLRDQVLTLLTFARSLDTTSVTPYVEIVLNTRNPVRAIWLERGPSFLHTVFKEI